jgi:glycosyltransferase involved in cell wall biosynthesis
MHNLRICQLLHSLHVGGAEVLATRLAQRLRAYYDFLFICIDELGTLGEEMRREGFPVHVLGRRQGLDWRCSLRLADLLKRERVDLLHAHQYTPFFYGITARLLWHRPPLLFTEHGRWFPDYPRRKRMIANRLLLERRDRVVGVGGSVRQALILNEGISAERVSVIYNGVDLARFGETQGREAVRRELGVGLEDLLIFQVARLDPLKDHATAIRAIGRLRHRRADTRLVLVGEGPELEAVREMIRQQALEGHVLLLGRRSDVARLLPAADLVLLTSVSEGIPLTLIEAMAARLPVVSTRVGGVEEIVQHGRTGLLAPAGDDAALADAILLLADDSEGRQQMGCLGRQRAEALFSEESMHASYLRLYGEMLGG